MKDQDNIFLSKFFIVFAALVILTIIIVLVARISSSVTNNSAGVADTDEFAKLQLEKLNERIAPVGHVVIGKVNAEVTARSGKEVVEAMCNSCHGTGVLGAPKIGDKAAWDARFANGLDTIMKNAKIGKGSMPPRGGNAELSDADLENAVVYLLTESGQKVDVAVSDLAATPSATEANSIIKAATKKTAVNNTAKGEDIYNSACVSCHGTGLMDAPKLGDKTDWGSRFTHGLDGVLKNAANGKGSMPPRGGNPELSDADLKSVVIYMLEQSGQTVAAKDRSQNIAKSIANQNSDVAAEKKLPVDEVSVIAEETTELSVEMEVATTAVPAVAVAPVVIDHSHGEQIYKKACSSCHDAGTDNAPRMDDAMAWVGLMAAGNEQLYSATVSGKGAMPPKGGHKDLTESDIKEAVDFIISKVISSL